MTGSSAAAGEPWPPRRYHSVVDAHRPVTAEFDELVAAVERERRQLAPLLPRCHRWRFHAILAMSVRDRGAPAGGSS